MSILIVFAAVITGIVVGAAIVCALFYAAQLYDIGRGLNL